MDEPGAAPGLRGVVRRAGLLDLGCLGIAFTVARAIGSAALSANSIDSWGAPASAS